MAETRKRRRLSSSGSFEGTKEIPAGGQQNENAPDRPAGAVDGHRRTLFVRSLPATATTENLTEFFSQSYPLKHATVVLDPSTKQSKGYGFVTFADPEDTQQALAELNGSVFQGRKLNIEIAEPRKRDIDEKAGKAVADKKERRRQDAQPPKLIVRNLPWSIMEPEQLSVLFRSFGKVKHATIPKKGARHAGFGFVVLRGKKNAEKAMEGVNGKEVDGRTLAVDWAVEKNVWEDNLQQNSTETTSDPLPASGEKEPNKEDDGDGSEEEGGVSLSGDEMDNEESDVSMADAEEDDDLDNADDDRENDDEEEVEDERNASTVFIRNLPFTSTDETLYEHFLQFGPIRYARVVFDHETDRPRGTAFVCFVKPEDATLCVREAPRQTDQGPTKSATGFKHSVLEDENRDPSGKYTMEGRVLQISHAVSKKEANRLTTEGTVRRDQRDKDKRRLYLVSEGTIPSDSPLYSKLSPTEIKMREASAKDRQKMVKTNPMLHISLTRLSIRNLPRSIDSKALKSLAREAVVGFAKDVKNGLREPLSREELRRSADAMKEAEKHRKTQGKGIVRQAKVIFEGREGSKVSEKSGGGRSRGFGFLEYTSHRSALMGLRWLNGHAVRSSSSSGEPDPEERKKRLIVEFAIENVQVVNRRHDKESKWRKKDGEDGQETKTSQNQGKSKTDSGKIGSKRKRDEGNEKEKGNAKVSKAPAGSDDKDNQVAKRNRIIAKKRMARRTRKGN